MNNRNNRNNRITRVKKSRKRKLIKKNVYDKKLIKSLSIFIILLLIIFIGIIIFNQIKYLSNINTLKFSKEKIENNNYNTSNQTSSENNITENKKEPELSDISFTMCAIGDVMCHNTQYWDAYNKTTNTYDFSYVFDDIRSYTSQPDITIGSLETSFAGEERGYSNYPRFNTPDALAYGLKEIGVDVLSTAGNHCLDMGFSGLSRTIDVLDSAGISHVGTYKTQNERDTLLIKNVKGVKIAFINYTYGTNGIPLPSDKPFCVNLIDKNLIKNDIESAKSQNVDLIVACMHWGTEYRTTANDEQKDLADFLFQNGVDIVLGNHPHTLEPMEKRTITLADGSTKDGFVIYALGNFICDQNAENTRNSIILNLTITKHADEKISIDKVEYTPIYMYKNPSLSNKRMKLLDIEKTLANYENGTDTSIGQSNYSYLKEQLEKIKSIVGEEIV